LPFGLRGEPAMLKKHRVDDINVFLVLEPGAKSMQCR
jgi:hypothetical protein